MIIYTCPECGGDLQEFILTSNPPMYRMRCFMCGWEGINEIPETIRIPYKSHIPQACRNCSNHPSNGGSGICNCTLGSPVIY